MSPSLLQAVTTAITRATGKEVGACQVSPVGGGCINEAYVLVALTPFFVKVNAAARAGLFEAEAEALRALAATGTVRVPEVITTGRHADRSFLVLEHVPMQAATTEARSWEAFGRQLAALHHALSPDGTFGWHAANFIGATPQPNAPTASWVTFWRDQRLGFQFKLAAERGVHFEGADRLLRVIPRFFADYTPAASLLHGDLWSGNASFTADGSPIIYDPACYYGDRECDLSFTELFGRFPTAFYEAYDATWPRHTSWPLRRDLYNLYHVLNHHHLFGASYREQAQRMIHRLNRPI